MIDTFDIFYDCNTLAKKKKTAARRATLEQFSLDWLSKDCVKKIDLGNCSQSATYCILCRCVQSRSMIEGWEKENWHEHWAKCFRCCNAHMNIHTKNAFQNPENIRCRTKVWINWCFHVSRIAYKFQAVFVSLIQNSHPLQNVAHNLHRLHGTRPVPM